MVILGISIGTRTSGIAIISKKGLITWNTLSFKDSWSVKKGRHIVGKYEKYLKEHKVTVVVLKIPRVSHHTEAILNLLQKIQSIIAYHGCMVEYKTQAEIKTAIPEIKNSRDLITHTAALYPVLLKEQARELASKNSYHAQMFEAVLVAHLAKQESSYPPN
jgi:RNase H-fold protein (predicted Holliday junction resolvase)